MVTVAAPNFRPKARVFSQHSKPKSISKAKAQFAVGIPMELPLVCRTPGEV